MTVVNANSIDIACVTETWLKQEVPTEIVDISGYVCHRKDRATRRGGGVAVYVRDDLPCRRLDSFECDELETVWLLYRAPRMSRSASHIAVAAVYHPPDANGRSLVTHLVDSLDRLTREHPYAGVVLLGDFNRLRDAALLSYPLRQVVRAATRGSATLDKIYTNIAEWYERPFTIPAVGRSDHNPVVMVTSSHDPRPLLLRLSCVN